jgi:hypothetical protein
VVIGPSVARVREQQASPPSAQRALPNAHLGRRGRIERLLGGRRHVRLVALQLTAQFCELRPQLAGGAAGGWGHRVSGAPPEGR